MVNHTFNPKSLGVKGQRKIYFITRPMEKKSCGDCSKRSACLV